MKNKNNNLIKINLWNCYSSNEDNKIDIHRIFLRQLIDKLNIENKNYYKKKIDKNYKVFIGKTKKGEIDFIASKNDKYKYIQVCFDISDENTRLREFSAFDKIVGNDKYIITLTKEDYSQNGIKQINIFDFLMNEDF